MQLHVDWQLKNMSNSSINLLDFKVKATPKRSFKAQKALRLTAIGLLFTVSFLSVVFFILVALSPIPQLNKQKDNLAATLSASHGDVAKLYIVNDRVNAISSFITQRQQFDSKINYIQSKISPGVSIDGISAEKKSLVVTLSSKSLLPLNKLINEISNVEQAPKDFSNVRLKALTRDEENNKFLLTIKFENI